jgi:hypothetical protein
MTGNKALPKAKFGSALQYMVKSYVGPGCLSLPLAFQNAGWGLGLAMLVVIIVSVVRNLFVLVHCKRHYEAEGVRNYADLALVQQIKLHNLFAPRPALRRRRRRRSFTSTPRLLGSTQRFASSIPPVCSPVKPPPFGSCEHLWHVPCHHRWAINR